MFCEFCCFASLYVCALAGQEKALDDLKLRLQRATIP